MHIRLFEHPAFGLNSAIPDLAVTGSLPATTPTVAYEGRLQIQNAIGDCTVEMTAGELPPGATVSVDNDTSEVVIAWPAFQSGDVTIPNGDFEDGDRDWNKGAGWSRTSDNPITGAFCAVYANQGGDSVISSALKAAITNPNDAIHASCMVRQGASSAGNAGACVRLEFFDGSGSPLSVAEGNLVSQGSNNEAKPSSVTAVPPSGAAFVSIACRGFRKRQNREVWVDTFSWDLSQPEVGTDLDRIWELTLLVRDSAGREAIWSGFIGQVSGQWWVVGSQEIYATADLVTWTLIPRTPNMFPEETVAAISAGAGRAFLVGSGTNGEVVSDTTPDSEIESEVVSLTVPGTATNAFSEIRSFDSGSILVMLGTVGSNQAARIRVSTDYGKTWTGYETPAGGSNQAISITRLNSGRWVCAARAGFNSYVWYTDNPLPNGGWQLSNLAEGVFRSAKFVSNGDTVAFVPGAWGRAYYSDNGADWTQVANPGNTSDDTRAFVANGPVFISSQGQNGKLKVSVDYGRSWSEVSLPAAVTPLFLDYANGVFTCSTSAAISYRSDDGLVWTQIEGAPPGRILRYIPYIG